MINCPQVSEVRTSAEVFLCLPRYIFVFLDSKELRYKITVINVNLLLSDLSF